MRASTKAADMQSSLLRCGKPRGYLFFGHELMGQERLMRAKVG